MAHRTNPANPLHEVRHLVERAPNADFLKSAELGYVEIRLGNLALVVQLESDLGVAFDACNRIDRDRLGHLPALLKRGSAQPQLNPKARQGSYVRNAACK